MKDIPVTGIAVTTTPKEQQDQQHVEIITTPRRSARAERGVAAIEAAKLRQVDMLRKVEAFRSKEDLAACQSETAFMIISCT